MLRWSFLGRCPMNKALALQEYLFSHNQSHILFAEHYPVYACPKDKYEDALWRTPPTARERDMLVRTESRGGSITYHGPGQIVCYMVLDTRAFGIQNIVATNHAIDTIVEKYLEPFAVPTYRRKTPVAAQGIWVRGRKIASRGFRRTGTFMRFGFALNLATNLSYFDRIYPCGIAIEMTTLLRETGTLVHPFQAAPRLAEHIGEVLGTEMKPYPDVLIENK